MRLSAPRKWTWIIAVVIAVLGIVGQIVEIPIVTEWGFWIEVLAFALLAVGTFFAGI